MSINLSTLVNQTNPVQLCKAWVNFNGTLNGTITPRSSYNVSSITKNGTGDYTINFATAMADANYSVGLSTVSYIFGGGLFCNVAGSATGGATLKTTSQIRIISCGNSAAYDSADISVQIFGN